MPMTGSMPLPTVSEFQSFLRSLVETVLPSWSIRPTRSLVPSGVPCPPLYFQVISSTVYLFFWYIQLSKSRLAKYVRLPSLA